jgi:hypothetical protein
LASVALGALLLAPAAAGSITVAENAAKPSLRVDASGNSEVSWSAGGVRRTLLVPPGGRVLPGGRLAGADVSRAAPTAGVPFARVVRAGRDGWTYALQVWRVLPGGPVELRFARWRGDRGPPLGEGYHDGRIAERVGGAGRPPRPDDLADT